MKLRAIQLDNVRQFAGQSLRISGLTDGLNVVAEPNEFGKSTLFDALQALFFTRYGSAGKEVKSLQPAQAGGAVRIMAEVESAGRRYRIEKRFLSGKMARITDLAPGGGVVAQEDGAEAWLARLLGGALDGPAGLLWVRQGAVGFEASDKSREMRRDILSSIAGEIDAMTGGRRFDAVLGRVEAALGLVVTDTGRPRAGGDWKVAQESVARLATEVTELTGQVASLSEALNQRRRAEARLAALDAPEAAAARARDQAATAAAHTAGEAHLAQVESATRQAEILRLQAEAAARPLAALTGAEAALAAALTARDASAGAAAEAALLRAVLAEEIAAAGAELLAAEVAWQTLAALSAAHARHQAATAAARAAADLAQRLAQAEAARAATEAAEASLAANTATPDRLAALDKAAVALREAQVRLASASVTLQVRYAGAGRLGLDGQDLPEGTTLLPGAATLSWPGLAEVRIDPGAGQGAAAQAALERAQAAWRQTLAATGCATPEAASALAGERAAAGQTVSVQKALLAALAPTGLAALRAEAARAAAATDTDAAAPEGPTPDPADLARAEARCQTASAAVAALRTRQEAALTADSRAAANLSHAQDRLAEDERARGDPATLAARRSALETALGQALARQAEADQAMRALTAAAPDLRTLRADRDRAQGAVEAARAEAEGLRQRLGALNGEIAARADQNVEERLTGATEALDGARRREVALAAEVAALDRLRQVLRETRGAAQEAYFGPVQEELRPLLAILHQDAALSFDPDRLLPGALRRGQTDEAVETLSGGTQEQLAILTRLAFARLLARQGRPVPIILDDALVHSDDERIVGMFKALNRVAADQQILVLTCRQMAFTALGGHRPLVTLEPMA